MVISVKKQQVCREKMPIDKFGRSLEIHNQSDLLDTYTIDNDIYIDFKNKSLTGVNDPKKDSDVVNKAYLENYLTKLDIITRKRLDEEEFVTKTHLEKVIKEYDDKRVKIVQKLLRDIFSTFRNRISVWPEHMYVSIKILKDLFTY